MEYYNSHQLIFPLHIPPGSERPKMNHAQEVELIAIAWVRKRIANSMFMAHKSLRNTEQFLCVPGSKFTWETGWNSKHSCKRLAIRV